MVEGLIFLSSPFSMCVDVWVLRNACQRIVSGQECSSTKMDFACAVRVPGGAYGKSNVRDVDSKLPAWLLYYGLER